MMYIPRDGSDSSPTFSLLRAGYLPPTPFDPTIALSIRSLELFHSLMRAQSSFSSQSFARLLADMHKVILCSQEALLLMLKLQVPYRSYLWTQIAAAFDVYFRILLKLRTLSEAALECDTPDYRLKHSCPACHYKVWAIVQYWSMLSLKSFSSQMHGQPL